MAAIGNDHRARIQICRVDSETAKTRRDDNARKSFAKRRNRVVRARCHFAHDGDPFHQFGQLSQYEVFQPSGTHIFELSDDDTNRVGEIFERISKEFDADYKYKYDVIRNLIFELLHFALKTQPSKNLDTQQHNASNRISSLFLELLERQFPIDDLHPTVQLRSASDFANQLNVHVNHLNRAVKEFTQKTTTQLISERVLQEAKILLRHSHWNVSEIAYALGFAEVTHFNNFFKKSMQTSPLKFRKELFKV